jgi:hypothetical protein
MNRAAFLPWLAALAACSQLPKDPDGTLDRVMRDRSFRVGIVAGAGGESVAVREHAYVARIAAATGARPRVERDSSELLLMRLAQGEIDLVVGEFQHEGPWSAHVHMLPALDRARVGDREAVVAAAAANGENRWIMLLDREARALGAEP